MRPHTHDLKYYEEMGIFTHLVITANALNPGVVLECCFSRGEALLKCLMLYTPTVVLDVKAKKFIVGPWDLEYPMFEYTTEGCRAASEFYFSKESTPLLERINDARQKQKQLDDDEDKITRIEEQLNVSKN